MKSTPAGTDSPTAQPVAGAPKTQAWASRFGLGTIRGRLVLSFVLMALLATTGVSMGAVVVGYLNGRQQVITRLESVAARKVLETDAWTQSARNELLAAITEEYAPERASIVLDMANASDYSDYYTRAMRNRLQLLVSQTRWLSEIFLLDRRGRVVLATSPLHEGLVFEEEPFFRKGLADANVQLRVNLPGTDETDSIVATPVRGPDGEVLGVAAAAINPQRFAGTLEERTGLGATGTASLIDGDYRPLDPANETAAVTPIHDPGIDAAVGGHLTGGAAYTDYRGTPVFGVYRWLPELGAGLVVKQDLAEALQAIVATVKITLGAALLTTLLAVGAALLITRSITRPLVELVEAATDIAAGDLERSAEVRSADEIGTLALAFNSMTSQLRSLIGSLEQRVHDRTSKLETANQALARRAVQLETSAQVSNVITSLRDIDDLLTSVVELIRDAFAYSSVHIFLLDTEQRELVLAAAAGPSLPAYQKISLHVPSLNGEVVKTGHALVINDVGQDNRYLLDDRLPETRSEMVIPLQAASQTIGTLDVHSSEVGAFLPDEVLVMQSLGDQVGIAIENARLYVRTHELAVLEERNRLARELHDSVTQSLYSLSLLAEAAGRGAGPEVDQLTSGYLIRISEITAAMLREMRLLLNELRPPSLEEEGLLGALQQRLESVERRVGLEARLVAPDELDLDRTAEDGLYRIASEALNNSLKHSQATLVTVEVRTASGVVTLEIADNGRGFDLATGKRSGGMGLQTMAERARDLGGTLEIDTAPDMGCIVRATIRRASS